MLKLLKKEFVLAMHPITPMMLALAAMVLIPNYPYSVAFFYASMSIFFTCQKGREYNDVVYSLSLPVAKRDVVKARFLFVVLVELAQMTLMIPFALLSRRINPQNLAGMDPNVALFGVGFLVYGLFNLVFFSTYYKDVNKVGIAFVKSSIVIFAYTVVDIVATYAVPFVRDALDTKDPLHLPEKLIFFGLCVLVYVILTVTTYQKSVRNFAKQDLN